MNDLSTLYDDAATIGLPLDHHESDLYLKDGPLARLLLKRSGLNAWRFRSNIDGQAWWDVPFAYLPWWRKRCEVQP